MYREQVCAVARHAERADEGFASRWPMTSDAARFPFDPPLTTTGIVDAHDLGCKIKSAIINWGNVPPVVVSSPYKRCVQTACEICSVLNAPLLIDRQLGEMFSPALFGGEIEPKNIHRPFSTARAYALDRGVAIRSKCVGRKPLWPESTEDARMRFAKRFQEYVNRGIMAQRHFILISHAEAVAAAVSCLSGAPEGILHVDPCGFFTARRFCLSPEKCLASKQKIGDDKDIALLNDDDEEVSKGWKIQTDGILSFRPSPKNSNRKFSLGEALLNLPKEPLEKINGPLSCSPKTPSSACFLDWASTPPFTPQRIRSKSARISQSRRNSRGNCGASPTEPGTPMPDSCCSPLSPNSNGTPVRTPGTRRRNLPETSAQPCDSRRRKKHEPGKFRSDPGKYSTSPWCSSNIAEECSPLLPPTNRHVLSSWHLKSSSLLQGASSSATSEQDELSTPGGLSISSKQESEGGEISFNLSLGNSRLLRRRVSTGDLGQLKENVEVSNKNQVERSESLDAEEEAPPHLPIRMIQSLSDIAKAKHTSLNLGNSSLLRRRFSNRSIQSFASSGGLSSQSDPDAEDEKDQTPFPSHETMSTESDANLQLFRMMTEEETPTAMTPSSSCDTASPQMLRSISTTSGNVMIMMVDEDSVSDFVQKPELSFCDSTTDSHEGSAPSESSSFSSQRSDLVNNPGI